MVGEEYQTNQGYQNYEVNDKPKKKINFLLLIILGLLIIIVFSIFAVIYRPSNQIIPETPSETKNDSFVEPEIPSDKAADLAEQIFLESQGKSEDDKYFMTLEAAKTKAESEADAILLCSLNQNPKYKSYCLQELAEEEINPNYCKIIPDPKQKDDCYMLLILQGEDQYCEELVMRDSKDFCELLLNS